MLFYSSMLVSLGLFRVRDFERRSSCGGEFGAHDIGNAAQCAIEEQCDVDIVNGHHKEICDRHRGLIGTDD